MGAVTDDKPVVPFCHVLDEELSDIEVSRTVRLKTGAQGPGKASLDGAQHTESPKKEAEQVFARAHQTQLVGLALSGGGIRSATFNLGVLQALAELKLLRFVDYLSTVSGGGYIGSWLTAWIGRENSCDTVEHELASAKPMELSEPTQRKVVEAPEIGFLRQYSNYLTPKTGFFSADTWTVVSTYLRNLTLNFTIIIPFLAVLVMLPYLTAEGSRLIGGESTWTGVVALLLLFASAWKVGKNFRFFFPDGKIRHARYPLRQWAVIITVVVPVFVASVLGSHWLWTRPMTAAIPPWHWMIGGAVVYSLLWGFGWLAGTLSQSRPIPLSRSTAGAEDREKSPDNGTGRQEVGKQDKVSWPAIILSAPVTGLVSGLLLMGLNRLFAWVIPSVGCLGHWHIISWATLLTLQVFSRTVTVHIGLMGRAFPDANREWWSRLGGWLLIVLLGWGALFAIAVLGPPALIWAKGTGAALIGSGWLVSTISGVLVGKSPATGTKDANRWMELVAKVAPFVFIVGLLAFLALGIQAYFAGSWSTLWNAGGGFNELAGRGLESFNGGFCLQFLYLSAAFLLLAAILSWRVDINQFSMHLFYRNRLIRCYLGATNPDRARTSQPFTGFDPRDDLGLAEFSSHAANRGNGIHPGPYPILNAALNLVNSENLAWQQRKAASFVFTPRFCGYELPATQRENRQGGFRPTGEYAVKDGGISLGQVMAISGAAATPSMGYHSSPPLAFLMTVFNVRLGWWAGNPSHRNSWKKSGPTVGLRYLLSELFGLTNKNSPFVYLSDGGHFENLGIYELVRRRCRYIIACDAGHDDKLAFEDLGNAVRKCSTDLGIDIEIDVSQIRRQGDEKQSRWHCAVGTVHYDRIDPGAAHGILVYLKPTLTGDEPSDIQEYAAAQAEFPHQATADQWFDESQFESYRKLGCHVGLATFSTARDRALLAAEGAVLDMERLFVTLRESWYPPASAQDGSFSRHTEALAEIFNRIRGDENLKYLDHQFYPEWEKLTGSALPRPPLQYWLPEKYDEIRSGFYLCNSLIQLMENVYLDLNLERDYDHPDNRGWMNLFKHWSWSGMFRITWAISASTYGTRFQAFCQQRLGLDIGEIAVSERSEEEALATRDMNFVEKRWINRVREKHSDAKLRLFLMQIAAREPWTAEDNPNQDNGTTLKFTFGIALADQDGRLLFFRVRDHLRKMGLARKALTKLIERFGLVITDKINSETAQISDKAGQKRFARIVRSVLYELK
jgi:hypothetical protein